MRCISPSRRAISRPICPACSHVSVWSSTLQNFSGVTVVRHYSITRVVEYWRIGVVEC
jgi:hypothetical protein